MQFGCDINRQRIQPAFSGQRAKCPVCDEEIIGHCGQIIIWHWKHLNNSNCDPWKEGETEWHRSWKNHFPEAWREVIIQRDGQIHRADIQTDSGCVVEFQNSPISPSEISEREVFYGNMVWVINALEFKNNFIMSSVVKNKLREIDREIDWNLNEIRDELKKGLSNQNEAIKDYSYQISGTLHDIDQKGIQVEVLKGINIPQVSKDLFSFWSKNKPYWGEYNIIPVRELQGDFQTEYFKLFTSIEECQKEIIKCKDKISSILKLADFYYDNVTYKLIEFDKVESKNYHRVSAVKKDTTSTFDPLIIKFLNEEEFIRLKIQKNNYEIFFDPAILITQIKSTETELEIKSIELINQLRDLEVRISGVLGERTITFSNKLLKDIEDLSKERLQLIADKIRKENEIVLFEQEKRKEINDYDQEMAEADKQRRGEVMWKYKKKYTFQWKNERRSWQFARKTIYFDTGEDFLLMLKSDEVVEKIPKQDFIQNLLAIALKTVCPEK